MLDLKGPEASRIIDDEIDLSAGARAPEIQCTIALGIGDPGPEVLGNESFEGAAVDLFSVVKRPVCVKGS